MLEMLLGNKAGANPGTWAQLSDLGGPSVRTGCCAAAIDDKVYTFGGTMNVPATVRYGDLRCYDTTLNSWSSKKTGPPVRYGAVGLAARGKFYIHGGRGDSAYLKDLWVYDPSLDTWASKTAAGINRAIGAGCAVDGMLYFAAGWTTTYSNDFRSYNIDTDTWTTLSSLPGEVRQAAGMAAVGTKLYLYGGVNITTPRLNDFWCYDTLTGEWVQLPDGPEGRTNHSMVAIGGKLYVHGGTTAVAWGGQTWCYDPDTAEWAAMKALLPGHSIHYAAVCQDKMFIGTGQTSGGSAGVVHDCWQYTPPL